MGARFLEDRETLFFRNKYILNLLYLKLGPLSLFSTKASSVWICAAACKIDQKCTFSSISGNVCNASGACWNGKTLKIAPPTAAFTQ